MCKAAVGKTAFVTCEFVESPAQLDNFSVTVQQYRQVGLPDTASSPTRLEASVISAQKKISRH